MKDTLRLDISGTMFRIKNSTLQNIPTSRLANLNDLCEEYDRKSGVYIFDRDAVSFRYILNAYINGELHAPKDVCPNQFKTELEFWDIPIKLLSLCCLKHFYDGQEDIDTLQILIERSHETPLAKISTVTEPSANSSFKAWDTTTENEVKSNDAYTKLTNENKKNVNGNVGTTRTASSAPPSLWLLLEESNSSTAAKVWCFIYLAVVVVSVIVLTIWTQVVVRVDLYIEQNTNAVPNYTYFNMPSQMKTYLEHKYSPLLLLLGLTDPHPALLAADAFCMAVFIVELIVHFCACPSKSQYLRSKFNVAKILLCICMITASGLEMNKSHMIGNNELLKFFLIMKSISVFRLIFIFRLRKLYKDFDLLLLAISHSFSELVLLLFSFSILVIVYGTIMFSTELETDTFKNPLYAMWWALVTMTTVGYGDFYPTTTLSYFVGGVCAVNGLIVIALPIAAIASNFSLFYSRNGFLTKHMNAVKQGCEKSNTRNGDLTKPLNVVKQDHEISNMRNGDLTKHLNSVKQGSEKPNTKNGNLTKHLNAGKRWREQSNTRNVDLIKHVNTAKPGKEKLKPRNGDVIKYGMMLK